MGNLYPHVCTRFGKLKLEFNELWVHFCTPPHTAHVTQNWLRSSCSNFINSDKWLLNLPDHNPLDYHVWGGGAMMEAYHKLQPKPKTIPELKDALQRI